MSSRSHLHRAGRFEVSGTLGGLVCVALVVLILLASGTALAQDSKFQFSERNLKKMVKVRAAMEAGDTAGMKTILESINLKRAKPYGRATVHQMLGNLATQEEEPDYAAALMHMEAATAEEALRPVEHMRTVYFVGQLQAMQGKYKEAVVTLEDWFKKTEDYEGVTPNSVNFYTLAVTYYQADMPEKALVPARKAVDMSDDPREAWMRLLLSLYLERNEYQNALNILDDIILKYPNKSYWQQMAAIYSELDKMDKSLSVQQLAQGEGFITEDRDLTRLAQMLMVEGLPHRGAAIMEKGLEDGSIEATEDAYNTYSNTLLQSREWEKALDPLSKAAQMKKNGDLFVRVAQVNLQLGRWGDARQALDQAFQKGGLGDEGQAHILYGIAASNDKKWGTATGAFTRARGYKGTRDTAEKWLKFVEREKLRLGITQ